MSSAISFAYFTEILYLNIPELVQIFADGKQRFLVLFFHGVLCDTPEKKTPKKNQGLPINTVPCFFS